MINQHSSTAEKITLFQSLFRGRSDVYPRRFQNRKTQKSGYAPACKNEWVRNICQKPRIKCMDCQHRQFISINDEVVYWHLQGYDNKGQDFVMGIYPMLLDETCYFLAVDFDKAAWEQDAVAFLKTCHQKNLPAVLERSRSGKGAHVWLFFEESISAALARKLGASILTETMESNPGVGLDSYDRFFPNQDTLPRGGFGNLIALPLQKAARHAGNSVFIDEQLQDIEDQWAYLAGIKKITSVEIEQLVSEAEAKGRVVGIRLEIIEEENRTPWKPPVPLPIIDTLPKTVHLIISNEIFIEKESLPSPLLNRLIRIAAFQNPDFYKAQAMRLNEVHVYDYADLAVPMLERMFQRRSCAYEAVGYKIIQPASAYPGWPADVVLPVEPLWKNDYGSTIRRLVADGVDNSLAQLFSDVARLESDQIDRARSLIEGFLFCRLETLPETKGRFQLNHVLTIPFDGLGGMEVDLICGDARVAIEIDGIQHLSSKEAYRTDRRKDLLLQEHGYTILRFLAMDVSKRLDVVLDTILRVLYKSKPNQQAIN